MSTIQNEPLRDISDTLGALLIAQFPEIKSAARGWPDPSWFRVEGNLPAVRFWGVSDKGAHDCSAFDIAEERTNPDGSGLVVSEQMLLEILLQVSVFASDKGELDSLAWRVKQHLIRGQRFALYDHTVSPPTPTGEHALLRYKGDSGDVKGELNFWARHLTFAATVPVLDAAPAWKVTAPTPDVTQM